MSSNLSLSGLASGVDTNSIIQQLLALERGPQNRLKLQQSVSRVRQDGLRDVSTRLRNLENAARDLRSAGLWADTQSAESTDASRVAVTRLGPGGPGGYQIEVSRLARAEQRSFTYTPQDSDGEISIGGATIEVAAGSDLSTVVAAINSASGAAAYAAVVTAADGSRQLVLSSRTPGAANGFSASGPSIQEDADKYLAGADAQFTIDGVAHTSPTNVVKDAIPGLQLTLKGVTGTNPVAVNVSVPGPDLDAIKAKLRTFVDQYNSTVDFISGKLSEEKVPGATSESDAAKGVLRGDTGLSSLLNKLRTTVSSYTSSSSTIRSLSALGITTGATTGGGTINQDSLKGKLTLDDGQLAKALASDPAGVRNFLGQAIGDGGFARELEGVVHSSTQSGGTLDNRISQEDSNRRRLTAQIADMDRRLQAKQDRLKAQYAAMETALSKGQTHGQWLSGQLQALSNLHR
jgi:flagellar hook-associated protein 2